MTFFLKVFLKNMFNKLNYMCVQTLSHNLCAFHIKSQIIR